MSPFFNFSIYFSNSLLKFSFLLNSSSSSSIVLIDVCIKFNLPFNLSLFSIIVNFKSFLCSSFNDFNSSIFIFLIKVKSSFSILGLFEISLICFIIFFIYNFCSSFILLTITDFVVIAGLFFSILP